MDMHQVILEELAKIEETEHVKILHAVESGSRAWGFESPDSDYDVRFIYVREKNDYLRLDPFRDVIELPVDEVLDVNGWDLKKAMALSIKSNPTLFEWCNSPVVYRTSAEFQQCQQVMFSYFTAKSGLFHYQKMASGLYQQALKKDTMKPKWYLYMLRSILACKWIMKENTPPPVLFETLKEALLPADLSSAIEDLLHLKKNTPEGYEVEKIQVLLTYAHQALCEVETAIAALPDNQPTKYGPMNQLFLEMLDA